MEGAKFVLLAVLALVGVGFVMFWLRSQGAAPTWRESLIGFVTNFFDTFGIGSFATTTSAYKLWGLVPDEHIPGTLNVGHTLATITQAFIFITVVQVGMSTLIAMIVAAVVGAWLGAPIVARWPRRRIQIGMGIALIVAAALFTYKNLKGDPTGGTTTSLEGWRFAVGVIGNFVLGVLMTLGIGLYGPCMILIALLGMSPITAFPIMMGSCAFLMPVGSTRFIEKRSYALRPALGLALGGVPAVLVAVYIVKNLNAVYVRWGVVVVVIYTALAMLRSALREAQPVPAKGGAPAALPARD